MTNFDESDGKNVPSHAIFHTWRILNFGSKKMRFEP